MSAPPVGPPPPEATKLLLDVFAEAYRQELGAEEDVHRTLPFFGTALGIVIAALGYAAGRLPRWSELPGPAAPHGGRAGYVAAVALLVLSVLEAGCVLVWLARAIASRQYHRIGPEAALADRVAELQAAHAAAGVVGERLDAALVQDVRHVLLQSYMAVTPLNRAANRRRSGFRARAGSHLVRSLIWALAATTLIFMADKFGVLSGALQ
jgi:hypothetical protein